MPPGCTMAGAALSTVKDCQAPTSFGCALPMAANGALKLSRLSLEPSDRKVSLLQAGQDFDTAFVISLPILGRAGATGRSNQKLRAEFLLQVDHIFTDR